MAFIDSRRELSNVWFDSFANRKLGVDIDANNCSSFELADDERFLIEGAMFATVASNAGYTVLNFPLLPVIRLYIDWQTHNQHLVTLLQTGTYYDKIIRKCATEPWYNHTLWQGCLFLKPLV